MATGLVRDLDLGRQNATVILRDFASSGYVYNGTRNTNLGFQRVGRVEVRDADGMYHTSFTVANSLNAMWAILN